MPGTALTQWPSRPTVAVNGEVGPVLLIVMHEYGTWRARPRQTVTFGRGRDCTITLPVGDRGLSRSAGSLSFHDGAWWLRNDSAASLLYLSGDRGFRVDLPPGMQIPVQQWHAKVRMQGVFDSYTLRLRLPDLDDVPSQDDAPGQAGQMPAPSSPPGTAGHLGDQHPVPCPAHRLGPAGPGRPVRGVPQLAARGRPRAALGEGHR
jgi:predicted component of type VI protein secretion system